ncbi:unnamed protein product [Symbiodinium pilosum]|uniref:Uncharacterized protein n=1 Tax=Symbiodinium pilosum TaxID=2952 RepID=A0A812REC5_SYMPI|nr:unnamed protein product [Symbiodinium pilosum]
MEPVSPLRPGGTPNLAGLGSLHVPSSDYSSLSPCALKTTQSPDATISSPTLKAPGGYSYAGFAARENSFSTLGYSQAYSTSQTTNGFSGLQELSTEVQRKAVEWERQIESLDAKELEIHQTQLRLIREQTAAFRSDFTALRKELADTKAIVQRQQASANEQGARLDDILARERQDRDASHTSLGSRVETMERSLPKLKDEIASLKLLLRGQDVVMILQAHEEEMKSIKDSHADLKNRHSAKEQHHATIQQRVDYLEKMMGDSADKHAAHVKQLEELRRSHDDTHSRHEALRREKESLHSRHATFEERLANLERFLSESLDKHSRELSDHRTAHGRTSGETQALREKHASVEERLKFLEQSIGDSVERHASELKQAKLQLETLHGKLSDEQGHRESRDQHHATLEERMRFVEQSLGDSAEKHSRELRAHKDSREQQHASLKEKVSYMEKLIGDSADEHARKLEAHKRDLEDHKRSLSNHQQAFDEHRKQAQNQQAAVERHASFEQRLDFLERALGDSAQHHTGQLRAAKAELEQRHEAHQAATGSLADRIDYLEKWFGGLPGFQPPLPGVVRPCERLLDMS